MSWFPPKNRCSQATVGEKSSARGTWRRCVASRPNAKREPPRKGARDDHYQETVRKALTGETNMDDAKRDLIIRAEWTRLDAIDAECREKSALNCESRTVGRLRPRPLSATTGAS